MFLAQRILTYLFAGACTLQASVPCWTAAVATVEGTLALFRNTVDEFKDKIGDLQREIGGLDNTVYRAIGQLNNEIDILDRWMGIARPLSENLNSDTYKAKVIAKVKRLRQVVVLGVKDLRNVANEFLELPETIFPDAD